MIPIYNEKNEAIQELPAELQEVLRRYDISRTDNDLDEVVFAVLRDLKPSLLFANISDETNFIGDLGLDSLAIAEFVFFFEDVFSIRITNKELSEMKSLGELKSFLKEKLG